MKTSLKLLTLTGLFILFACEDRKTHSPPKEEKAETEASISFEQYLNSLEMIELPLRHNPHAKLPEISTGYDKKGFQQYHHVWTLQPLGILYKSDQSIGIIDCSVGDWGLVPFLTTYDMAGNKIDSLDFYSVSGRDMGYEAIEYLIIHEDLSLSIKDTVKRWDINEDGSDIIEGSMKITTGKAEYQIQRDGKVQKQKKSEDS